MPTPTAYYNEFDPKAAAWLRELIREGLIAPGDVDDRSIVDVHPADLIGYTQCHFFAGIGGWSYALRLAGWPDDRPVWTASLPCQPFSAAGKQLGTDDSRHLWPVFKPLAEKCRPSKIFGEQVASKAGREWLAGVRADLEALGYAVGAADLCAAGVGAPHIRQRLYWMADANQGREGLESGGRGRMVAGRAQFDAQPGLGRGGEAGGMAESEGKQHDGAGNARRGRRQSSDGSATGWLGDADVEGQPRKPFGLMGSGHQGHWSDFDILACTDGKSRRVESGTFPLAHGIPARMGRLRGYGNAIVAPLAAEFIRASFG